MMRTHKELFHAILECQTHHEAKQIIKELVDLAVGAGYDVQDAQFNVRFSVGYITGYADTEERRQELTGLFSSGHPILGFDHDQH
jgi:hypothetical protein